MQKTKTICRLANSAENDAKKKKLKGGRVIIVQQT